MNNPPDGMTNLLGARLSRRSALRLGIGALGGAALALGGRFAEPLTRGGVALAASSGTTVTDSQGRVYYSETTRHRITRADSALAAPTRYAGVTNTPGFRDGARLQALFNAPTQLAVNPAATRLYVIDSNNRAVRQINAGSGTTATTISQATAAASGGVSTWGPSGIAVDPLTNNLIIADAVNHVVWTWNTSLGQLTLLAGSPGQPGLDDRVGTGPRLTSPGEGQASSDRRLFTGEQRERGGRVGRNGRGFNVGVLG